MTELADPEFFLHVAAQTCSRSTRMASLSAEVYSRGRIVFTLSAWWQMCVVVGSTPAYRESDNDLEELGGT